MNTSCTIKQVTTRIDLERFIQLPWKIYKNDCYWVPPLQRDMKIMFNSLKNPFYSHNDMQLFVAMKGSEAVGRIAGILNREHNRHHNDTSGFFGFFESLNDQSIAHALLNTVKCWLRNKGCDKIYGPVNPDFHYTTGFLIDDFTSPPFFMMPYNKPWYPEYLLADGFTKCRDFNAWYIDKNTFKWNARHTNISRLLFDHYPVKIRTARLSHFKTELKIIHALYNNSMNEHWGFTPISWDAFYHMAKDLKYIIDPDLVLIAEYNNTPVGFLLALPDINEILIKIPNGKLWPKGVFSLLTYNRKIKSIRVITLGINKHVQHLGLGSLFYTEISKRAVNKGYYQAELSWIMEDNKLMNRAAQSLGAQKYKTYRVFEADIEKTYDT